MRGGARLRCSPPRRAATPRTARPSSPRPSASAAPRSRCCPASARRELSALGVVSGIHKPDGIVGDLGGGSLELIDVHGTRSAPASRCRSAAWRCRTPPASSIKKAEKIVEKALDDVPTAQARQGPHLLCRRRHLARARAAAHVADRLSAARDARLRHTGARGARILPPRASRRSGDAVADRSRRRRAPAAACLCARWCSSKSSARREPKDVVISALGVREACSIRCSSRRDAASRSAARRRARAQRAALALAAPWRGADRLDRPASWRRPGSTRPRRSGGCAMPPACSPISAGARIPTIAASSRSTSSPTRAFVGDRPSRPRLSGAGGVLPPCRPDRRGTVAALRELATTRMLDRARMLGAAMRVAYLVSAAMPGVLPHAPMRGRARQADAASCRRPAGSPASASRACGRSHA